MKKKIIKISIYLIINILQFHLINNTIFMNIKNLCVYCSSSDALDPIYFEKGKELGRKMASENITLIYGGAKVGLMGVLAKAVKQANGKVVGVIPELIFEKNIAYNDADEVIVTKDMRDRKATMETMADAFVALPGGFGTLEEIAEVITMKQLGMHTKPIIFFDINNFYASLFQQFEVFYHEHFSKEIFRKTYFVAHSADEIMEYLKNYEAETYHDKWYKSNKMPHEVMQEIEN